MRIQHLGRRDYHEVWARMRAFTEAREAGTEDALWTVEHPPVFTLGLGGRREHVHDPGAIPLVHSDRGGQVTYHGPGQLVVYTLLDLRRRALGVRVLVRALEQAVIQMLAGQGIVASRLPGAPGVYVDGAKVAALGLRVRRGCSYHGLALNVDMDLAPFARIDPCGHAGMAVTDCRRAGWATSLEAAAGALLPALAAQLAGQGAVEAVPA